MSLIIDEHREYLSDPVRLDAFRAAIRARVTPGDVIVDLGAGTGVLGLLACQAGAGRVYAIESSGMVTVARAVARANGFESRVVYVHGEAEHVTLPEPADGLVCDQIGRFAFDAGLLEMLAGAKRFLKPGAWAVPQEVELRVAPIEDPDVRARVAFWNRPVCGLDFAPVHQWAANTGYPRHLDVSQLLSPGASAGVVKLPPPVPALLSHRAILRIERAGVLDGIAGWFAAELGPGVALTNAPGAPNRLHRRNVVFPLTTPVPVSPGDQVDLTLQVLPADLVVTWRGTVIRANGRVAFSGSTLSGMLLTKDDLRRLQPDGVPRLTERGRARLTVLQLCNGTRSLREIEHEVLARHPSLFESDVDAAVFVAEVVTRYSE